MTNLELFPQEYFIKLQGVADFLTGRIVINESLGKYTAEVDIIQTESGKIHNHVTILYDQADAREALDLGVYHLKKFLIGI